MPKSIAISRACFGADVDVARASIARFVSVFLVSFSMQKKIVGVCGARIEQSVAESRRLQRVSDDVGASAILPIT